MVSVVAAMLFQDDPEIPVAAVGVGLGLMALWLVVLAVSVAALWAVFVKAGRPGWAAVVPIYNLVVLLDIVGKPLWWLALLLIPIVNFVVAIIISVELANRFGKGAAFGVGLALLAPIFYPLLAWGDARYQAGTPV